MKNKRIVRGAAIVVLVFLILGGVAIATMSRLLQPGRGEQTGARPATGLIQTIHDLAQVTIQPKEGFPGKHRLTLLCMGIDDNWTDGDQVYTAQARTDTLFLLSLDLDHKKVNMLSIPRDTYTHIAGTHWNTKINAAYATGGPQRAIDTVDELLGVRADHFLVLNIDSTKKMVDALGGVDVNVEHEMHYHDAWGHLSIDLMPGEQHLNADQAVGFARYRHPDAGQKPSLEDGDERRMYRQHVLLQAMVAKAKNFTTVADAPHFIDVTMSAIHTDLNRTQLYDLAAIFHGVQKDDIRTASLTGEDFRGPQGQAFYRLDSRKAEAYVALLIRGDETAARRLVPVVVENATGAPRLGRLAVGKLKAEGFTDVRLRASHTSGEQQTQTTVEDTSVIDPAASTEIAAGLGLPSVASRPSTAKINTQGETAPLIVTLGQDYEAANAAVASAD